MSDKYGLFNTDNDELVYPLIVDNKNLRTVHFHIENGKGCGEFGSLRCTANEWANYIKTGRIREMEGE